MSIFALLMVLQEIKPSLADGDAGFVLSGTTDLPDGTLLYLELFRSGSQAGEQLLFRATRVSGGAFRETARVFAGGNPAGRYYLRVRYDLNFQDRRDVGEALEKLGRTTAAGEAWLRIGDEAAQRKGYQACCEELSRALDALRAAALNPAEWNERSREILRRSDDRPEYRFYNLTEIAGPGLERVRAALAGYVRTGDARRLEQADESIRKAKAELRAPPDRNVLIQALQATSDRREFDTLILELASVVNESEYVFVQELAAAGPQNPAARALLQRLCR